MPLKVAEVFSSIQGEGLYIGTKQVFVRLTGCNLECSYCDTSWSWQATPKFKLSLDNYEKVYDNPVLPQQLAKDIAENLQSDVYAVSITGGEPLLQAEDLLDFLPVIGEKTKILMETNGTLPDKLDLLMPWIDIVSMDIKLPQYCNKDLFKKHEDFLRIAAAKNTYVKLVVSNDSNISDVVLAAETVAKVSPAITLILQPLTDLDGHFSLSAEDLQSLQSLLFNYLQDVRIIPQMHKLLGIK